MKGRLFFILLYPDTKDYDFESVLINYINFCNNNNYNYYYIYHDKEEDEKIHVHFLIHIPGSSSDKTIKSISAIGGIDDRWIEKMKSPKQCILYLTHQSSDSKDKYQYDWHDIKTNNESKVKEVYSNDEEQRNLFAIIDYIDSVGYITYMDFSKFILSQNLWSYYRRSGAIINNVIREHNNKYVKYQRKDELFVDE